MGFEIQPTTTPTPPAPPCQDCNDTMASNHFPLPAPEPGLFSDGVKH